MSNLSIRELEPPTHLHQFEANCGKMPDMSAPKWWLMVSYLPYTQGEKASGSKWEKWCHVYRVLKNVHDCYPSRHSPNNDIDNVL